jgi:hypothetical protein
MCSNLKTIGGLLIGLSLSFTLQACIISSRSDDGKWISQVYLFVPEELFEPSRISAMRYHEIREKLFSSKLRYYVSDELGIPSPHYAWRNDSNKPSPIEGAGKSTPIPISYFYFIQKNGTHINYRDFSEASGWSISRLEDLPYGYSLDGMKVIIIGTSSKQ